MKLVLKSLSKNLVSYKLIITGLFFVLIGCKESPVINTCSNALLDSVAVVNCISVIDGDTWKMQIGNDIFSIRVLGLDCFETKRNSRLEEQAQKNNISIDSAYNLGLKAKKLTEALLSNKQVKIVRDFKEDNFDTYNRLLRHCYINSISLKDTIINIGLNAE